MDELTADQLQPWLRLVLTPGVGRAKARQLLTEFGSPEAIFTQKPAALAACAGPKVAQALQQPALDLPAALARTQKWLATSPLHHVVVWGSLAYPEALADIEDPPVLLMAKGQLAVLRLPLSLAMVGSRSPSSQGAKDAASFAEELARNGIAVVSGLARGVDTAAHQGALKAGGVTIAIVGTGLDLVYPAQNTALAESLAEQGLVLSEYLLGTPPMAPHFPQRNRLISGLSAGTLVVEAALRSGSLITARMALEQGKEVFAIPGSIHSPLSKGCHQLIKQGAKLVESAADILEELRGQWVRPMGGRASSLGDSGQGSAYDDLSQDNAQDGTGGDPLLKILGHEVLTLDELQDFTGLDTPTLQVKLLALELDRRIARLPGGRYQRVMQG